MGRVIDQLREKLMPSINWTLLRKFKSSKIFGSNERPYLEKQYYFKKGVILNFIKKDIEKIFTPFFKKKHGNPKTLHFIVYFDPNPLQCERFCL